MEPITIRIADMFGGAGMGTSLLPQLEKELTKQLGIPVKVEVCVAIECEEDRCEIYRSLHPGAIVIHGNVKNEADLKEFIRIANEKHAQILCASPVCRSFSAANKSLGKKAHENNRLFLYVKKVIEACDFKAILIENVPAFLKARPTNVPELGNQTIGQYMYTFLNQKYNPTMGILNSADYSVPQTRRRSFILAIKKNLGNWIFPAKHDKWITIQEAIGDLPPLEPFPDPSNPYIYHKLHRWPKETIDVLRYTGPGDSAFLNKPTHRPKSKSGKTLQYYQSTMYRDDPNKTKGAILRKSAGKGSCHPGRLMGVDENGDKMCSETRPYSILELMIFMGFPRDFRFPAWCDDEEELLRDILGEGVCPPVMNLLLKQIIPTLIKDEQKKK